MDNIPVLIVEDNKSHLILEKLALAENHYDIRTASDANTALQILTEFQPRLILMDLQLPGMSGLQLTKKLKANPKYRGIIIVAITAYGMKGDREMALQAGCDAYLSKPIDIETFSETINQFLKKEDQTSPV